MSRLLPAALALLAVAAPGLPVPAAPRTVTSTPAPAPAPLVTLPAGSFRPGQQILVRLTGWPAGSVQVEICGNGGRRGALDCATSAAAHGQVPASGTATVPVLLGAPPVACPCLLRARTPTGTAEAGAPLTLTGVTAPPVVDAAGAAEFSITGLRAVDDSGPGGWFGLPGMVTVHLSLRNDGAVAVVDPPFALLSGTPGRVHTFVAAPALGTIGAGQTRDYRLRVPVEAAVVGRYEIHGRIEPPGRPVAFAVEMVRRPWGLPALAGVLVVVLLVSRARPATAGDRRGPPDGDHIDA